VRWTLTIFIQVFASEEPGVAIPLRGRTTHTVGVSLSHSFLTQSDDGASWVSPDKRYFQIHRKNRSSAAEPVRQ
jgi:hypothetical protein